MKLPIKFLVYFRHFFLLSLSLSPSSFYSCHFTCATASEKKTLGNKIYIYTRVYVHITYSIIICLVRRKDPSQRKNERKSDAETGIHECVLPMLCIYNRNIKYNINNMYSCIYIYITLRINLFVCHTTIHKHTIYLYHMSCCMPNFERLRCSLCLPLALSILFKHKQFSISFPRLYLIRPIIIYML